MQTNHKQAAVDSPLEAWCNVDGQLGSGEVLSWLYCSPSAHHIHPGGPVIRRSQGRDQERHIVELTIGKDAVHGRMHIGSTVAVAWLVTVRSTSGRVEAALAWLLVMGNASVARSSFRHSVLWQTGLKLEQNDDRLCLKT
jgi:hypothetical protein